MKGKRVYEVGRRAIRGGKVRDDAARMDKLSDADDPSWIQEGATDANIA